MGSDVGDLVAEAQRRRLVRIDGGDLVVLASQGHEATAGELAARAHRAWTWLGHQCDPCFAMPPLLVLDESDWPAFAPVPVYGMPQAWSDRLLAPATASDLFDEYAGAVVPSMTVEQIDVLSRIAGTPPDIGFAVSRVAVAHEVGHYFHHFDDTGATGFARHWIGELFANVAMYGYLAEHEPRLLPLIETICAVNAKASRADWSAHDIEAMGGGSPAGYIWAQFQLIRLAEQIWHSTGDAAFSRFRQTLHNPSMTDDEIGDALTGLDPRVAAAVRAWPHVEPVREQA